MGTISGRSGAALAKTPWYLVLWKPGGGTNATSRSSSSRSRKGSTAASFACTDECTIDTSGCQYVCGDNDADPGEECDGSSLDGETCMSLGFAGGPLACTNECTVDVSACHLCGNGTVDAGEECDGSDVPTCGDWFETLSAGTVVCDPWCKVDDAMCTIPANSVSAGDSHTVSDRSGRKSLKFSGFEWPSIAH